MSNLLLQGKIVVITGASMGIGLAVARDCDRNGARLILISRHIKDLRKAKSSLKGSEHEIYALDVSNSSAVQKFTDFISERYRYIDGLVNCAGIYGPIGKTEEVDPSAFLEVIHINLIGTFNMCHYLIPFLKKSSRGKIVNYSGGGAASAFPNYSGYAVSKVGVVRLTENIALEYRGEIDVNTIAPGFVVTRLHQQTLESGERAGKNFLEETKKQIEEGGVLPEKAARLTVFLLSNKSDKITGKFISAVWDLWEEKLFIQMLKEDKDFATVRRIDNKVFFKKV